MTDKTDMTAAELREQIEDLRERNDGLRGEALAFRIEASELRKQLDEVREREAQIWRVVSAKAREWSGHYEHGTDGRNTFVLFAEWAEIAALSQEPPASHAPGLRDSVIELHGVRADEKKATLELHLIADSSYDAEATYRISANQWTEVLRICEDAAPKEQP